MLYVHRIHNKQYLCILLVNMCCVHDCRDDEYFSIIYIFTDAAHFKTNQLDYKDHLKSKCQFMVPTMLRWLIYDLRNLFIILYLIIFNHLVCSSSLYCIAGCFFLLQFFKISLQSILYHLWTAKIQERIDNIIVSNFNSGL